MQASQDADKHDQRETNRLVHPQPTRPHPPVESLTQISVQPWSDPSSSRDPIESVSISSQTTASTIARPLGWSESISATSQVIMHGRSDGREREGGPVASQSTSTHRRSYAVPGTPGPSTLDPMVISDDEALPFSTDTVRSLFQSNSCTRLNSSRSRYLALPARVKVARVVLGCLPHLLLSPTCLPCPTLRIALMLLCILG